jgi:molybdopterin guanine dinucleotide-containing S/N-oxide reductase-like protein
MAKKLENGAQGWLSRPVGRRQVLQGMGAAGAVMLVGHATAINEILPEYGVEEVLTTADREGMIEVSVKNGMILRVESLDYPKMEATPMALNWHRRVYAPDRILYPMVRVDWEPGGGGDRTTRGQPRYRRVSWDEALDLVAGELQRVVDSYGNEAIYNTSTWATAGSLHVKDNQVRKLLNLIGGYSTRLGNKSYACWSWTAPHVIGMGYPTHSMKDILENGKLVVFWGTDPINTTRTADGNGQHAKWVKELRRNGVKVITIDAISTETAEASDQWIAPRPGSDGAMMAAIANVMIAEDLYDKDFIDQYTLGFDEFRAYVMGESDGQPKTPEWAAEKADVPAETIRALAMEFATTKGVMLAPGFGLQRAEFGEHVGVMLPVALAAMKGELGTNGGGLAVYVYGSHGRPQTVGRGPNGFSAGRNPVTQLILEQGFARQLLDAPVTFNHNGTEYRYPEEGKSEIKLAYIAAGSRVVNQHDQINQQLEALQKLETFIVQDSWWTAGARLADIVLPVATLFERNDVTQSGEYVIFQHQIIEPLGESMTDFQICSALADRLGVKDDFIEGKETEEAWLRELYAASDVPMSFEEFREAGYYVLPTQDSPEIPAGPFHAFRENPALNPLGTPSGKIEITPSAIAGFGYDDCPAVPQWMEPSEWLGSPKAEEYPFHLITKHPWWRRHSSYGNVDTLNEVAKINGFEPVIINPADAAAKGIVTGDVVRVFNDRGQILCGALVTDAVRPNVVIVQQGSWYDPAEPGVVGSLDFGGCANVLTREGGSSQQAQSPVAHTGLVNFEKYEGMAAPNDFAPIQPA